MAYGDSARNNVAFPLNNAMNVDNPRKELADNISERAKADIAERVKAARPHVFMELLALIGARNSLVTPEQINALGAVASHLFHADDIGLRLREACGDAGISVGLIEHWLNSDAGRDVIARAHADRGNDHLVEVRRDPSIKELVDLYGVTPEEENSMNLTHIVSERRRSELRRRAEGIAAPTETVQTDAAEPKLWGAAGVSKSTHYARLNRAAEQSAAALMAEATGHPLEEKEPWKALGISKATWHRRNAKAGETKSRTTRDPTELIGTVGTFTTHFNINKYRVAPSPENRLTHTDPPPHLALTAECRQHTATSLRLGLVWNPQNANTDAAIRDWVSPPGHSLTDEQWDAWDRSCQSAEHSMRRHNAVEIARGRKLESERDARIAAGLEPTREQAAAAKEAADRASIEAGAPPRGIPPELWAWVPAKLRQKVREIATQLYLYGSTSENAVAEATEMLCRLESAKQTLAALRPDGGERLARCVPGWEPPTLEAVDIALRRYDQENDIVAQVLARIPDAPRGTVEDLAHKHWSTADASDKIIAELVAPQPEPKIPEDRRRYEIEVFRYLFPKYPNLTVEQLSEIQELAVQMRLQSAYPGFPYALHYNEIDQALAIWHEKNGIIDTHRTR